jgi:hypothetical protein
MDGGVGLLAVRWMLLCHLPGWPRLFQMSIPDIRNVPNSSGRHTAQETFNLVALGRTVKRNGRHSKITSILLDQNISGGFGRPKKRVLSIIDAHGFRDPLLGTRAPARFPTLSIVPGVAADWAYLRKPYLSK